MNRNHWDIKKAMNIFYTSQIYQLMRNGISDMPKYVYGEDGYRGAGGRDQPL